MHVIVRSIRVVLVLAITLSKLTLAEVRRFSYSPPYLGKLEWNATDQKQTAGFFTEKKTPFLRSYGLCFIER